MINEQTPTQQPNQTVEGNNTTVVVDTPTTGGAPVVTTSAEGTPPAQVAAPQNTTEATPPSNTNPADFFSIEIPNFSSKTVEDYQRELQELENDEYIKDYLNAKKSGNLDAFRQNWNARINPTDYARLVAENPEKLYMDKMQEENPYLSKDTIKQFYEQQLDENGAIRPELYQNLMAYAEKKKAESTKRFEFTNPQETPEQQDNYVKSIAKWAEGYVDKNILPMPDGKGGFTYTKEHIGRTLDAFEYIEKVVKSGMYKRDPQVLSQILDIVTKGVLTKDVISNVLPAWQASAKVDVLSQHANLQEPPKIGSSGIPESMQTDKTPAQKAIEAYKAKIQEELNAKTRNPN